MKTRIIHTKVWKDEWFVSLSPEAKLLWFYLLTNEKINISGIFELTDREICFDLGINVTDKTKKELRPKAIFCRNWVFVPNVDKYNSYRNSPLNKKAFSKEISYIPEDIAREILTDTSIDTSIYTNHILLEIRNKKQEIINKKSEIENKELEIGNIEQEGELSEKDMELLEEKKKQLYNQMGW